MTTPSRAAREWVDGLQSRDGGWGAFDADNTYYYLNNIPFADHGALLDPPTEDVSGRCVGMLAQLGEAGRAARMKAGAGLSGARRRRRTAAGSGRWGVNYIYGTWSALAGLNARGPRSAITPMMRKAARLAGRDPESGWRLGRELRQLQAGLQGL